MKLAVPISADFAAPALAIANLGVKTTFGDASSKGSRGAAGSLKSSSYDRLRADRDELKQVYALTAETRLIANFNQ
jgi:hypothetical protein